MVFVKPTAITWYTLHFMQKVGLLLSPASILLTFNFVWGKYYETAYLPQVDSLFIELPFIEKDDWETKLKFNILLNLIFWLPHCLLARAWFKEFLNKITNNQYYYL